jgi:uncharacterized membrane protein HdeD (DUF308 family)
MRSDFKGVAWALGLWGALSVIFGLLIVAWPNITIRAFLIVLGLYLLTTGVVMAVGSLINRRDHWVGGALIGVLSAVAGLYVFSHPQISAFAVLTLIAFWALAVGVLSIVAGFEAKKTNWMLILSGAVYTLFGIYIFDNPKGGAIALVWLIGLSVIASGVLLIIAASEAYGLSKQLPQTKR